MELISTCSIAPVVCSGLGLLTTSSKEGAIKGGLVGFGVNVGLIGTLMYILVSTSPSNSEKKS